MSTRGIFGNFEKPQILRRFLKATKISYSSKLCPGIRSKCEHLKSFRLFYKATNFHILHNFVSAFGSACVSGDDHTIDRSMRCP